MDDDYQLRRVTHLRRSALIFAWLFALTPPYAFCLAGVIHRAFYDCCSARYPWEAALCLALSVPSLACFWASSNLYRGLEKRWDKYKVSLVTLSAFGSLAMGTIIESYALWYVGVLFFALAPCWLIEIYRSEAVRLGLSAASYWCGLHHLLTLGMLMALGSGPDQNWERMLPFYWLFTVLALGFFQRELRQDIEGRLAVQ